MAQAKERNLPEDVQRLLTEPLNPAAIVSLGVCHRRMLVLGDDERPGAIRHALAGVLQFAALQI